LHAPVKFKVLMVGKTKDDWIKQGIAVYLKRLQPLAKLELVELPDASLRTSSDIRQVRQKEAATCLKQLSPEDYLVLLDVQGATKTSLEFAAFLASLSDNKNVVFLIGGVFGVDDTLRERANACLSLSALTYTHQLARLILVEQLYRALMIQNKRSYHH